MSSEERATTEKARSPQVRFFVLGMSKRLASPDLRKGVAFEEVREVVGSLFVEGPCGW